MIQGRFAPSPTGPLHLGSLLTAVGSFLSARSRGGKWLVRFDDLDSPRNAPGAVGHILQTLQSHGLYPDAPPQFQSRNLASYEAALVCLTEAGHTFGCRCSRKLLDGSTIYPGNCRTLGLAGPDTAVRLRMPALRTEFPDRIQGFQSSDVTRTVGDIILRRRDGCFAYHLACAVDDGSGGISEVVRGADLLTETHAQLVIMKLLRLNVPAYAHLPLLRDPDGHKLSKQSHAPAVDNARPQENLAFCLRLLGLVLPADISGWPVSQLLAFGASAFESQKVPMVLPRLPLP